jgi:hypothetical protein
VPVSATLAQRAAASALPLAGAFAGGYIVGEAIAPYLMDPLIDAIQNDWFAKGERGRTAKPEGTDNPSKKFRYDEKSKRWWYKDQNGKKILKPPGYEPPKGLFPILGNDDDGGC